MEQTFVLDKKVHTEGSSGDKDKFEFIPQKDPLRQYVKLVINSEIIEEVCETMNLPMGVGDTITLSTKLKNVQHGLKGL